MNTLLQRRRTTALLKPGAVKVAAIIIGSLFYFQLQAQMGGNVLKLGGTSGYVEVPGVALDNGGPITIEFWSYVSQHDVQESSVFTIGSDGANNVQAHAPWSDYKLYWDYGLTANGGRLHTDYAAYLNKWTHVALVSEGNDGGFKAIYLDGMLAAWDLVSDGPDERVSGFTIGKNGTLYHRGLIDEFRIWNVARSEDEIFLNMSVPATGFESGIKAVYHFDDAAGSATTADASFNGFNGTLVGDASIVAPGAIDPAPYVLSCERQDPATVETIATHVTFRVTFSEAVTGVDAQDFTTVVTGYLTTGTPTLNAISTSVYDVTVPVDGFGSVQLDIANNATIEDAGGNDVSKAIIDGEEYWIAHARFVSLGPGSGTMMANTRISYELTRRLTSGTVTWTRTDGSSDPGSPHVQALTGDELLDGQHNHTILTNAPNLVNGAIYMIEFKGVAFDGQVVPPVSMNDIFFDRNLTYADADPGFDPGDGTYDVRAIAVQQDGRIVIGGGFNTYNNQTRNHVARLNNDGTLDGTFDPGDGANSTINTILLQPDNKLIIAGEFTEYKGVDRSRIARLNSDGSLDDTFNPDVRELPVKTMAFQGDKILVGSQSVFFGEPLPTLSRLNADGSTDATFYAGDSPDGTINCLFVQDNGKIMIGGRFNNYGDRIARLNADGTVSEDFNFFYQDLGFEDELHSVTAMAAQPDGKIVVAGVVMYSDGGFEEFATRIFRLNANGTPDETFTPIIVRIYDWEETPEVHSMLLQGDGKIMIAGYFERCGDVNYNHIARLNSDGTPDLSFVPGGGADNVIKVMRAQTDGNILIGGQFSNYNSAWRESIARIDPVMPVVVSSLRHSPASGTTLATSVTFRVTFSEAVESVDINDFTLTATGNVTTGAPGVTATSATVFDVTVPSIAGTGTLRLDVLTNAMITDRTGNPYNTAFTTGESYTIGKNIQVITVDAIVAKTFPDNPFVVTAMSSSGLPVTITANSANISVTNNQVTMAGAGRASIIATQSGNDEYQAAPPVEVSFCINPAKPVISASFDDPEHPVLTSNAPSGNQWYLNDEIIANATQQTFHVIAPGTYNVRVTADNCVSEFSAGFLTVITGLPQGDTRENMDVSPNPTHDRLHVTGITIEERISIISITGNMQDARTVSLEGPVTVDVSGLAPGVYLLRVIGKSGVRTTRFIKK